MRKPSEDRELTVRLQNSEESAFREVFDRYHRQVYQFAYGFLKSRAQSEDVVQEAFLNFWVYRTKLALDIPLAPLLFTMTRRIIINHWQKCVTSDKFRKQLIHSLDEADNNTEAYTLSRDIERLSQEALLLLTERQREIFTLSRQEGLTYDEIADRLQISRNTVKYHLTNVLAVFRAYFAKNGILYTYLILFYFTVN